MKIQVWERVGDTSGKPWRWHFINKGRITYGAEAFPSKAHAIRAAKSVVLAVVKPMGMAPQFNPSVKDKKEPRMLNITWR
jgi:hypothetical protein